MKVAVGAVLVVGAAALPFGQPEPNGWDKAPDTFQFREASGSTPSDGFGGRQFFRTDGADGQTPQVPKGGPHGAGRSGQGRGFAMGRNLYGMVTEECRTAVATTCAVCAAAAPNGADGANGCAEQCASGTSEECRTCRQALAEQCKECIAANSAELMAAGCTQIACREATQQLCPVCETDGEKPMDDDCRFCAPDNTTDTCAACSARFEQRRETEEQCRACVESNSGALITAGCRQLECKAAVSGLCPTCESAMGQEDCRSCGPDNTTETCVACRETREACVECVQANNASLPEGCSFVLNQQRQSMSFRSFRDNAQGAPMGMGRGAPNGMRRGGDRAPESEECRAALGVTCPTCQCRKGTGDSDSDVCAAECADRRSEECAACRREAAEECKTCKNTNAATLIAAGCTQIACDQATQQLCPVCETNREQPMDDNCRFCAPDNTTETCVTCQAQAEEQRAVAEQCNACKEQNFDVLADSGCTRFVCQRAAQALCAVCATVTVREECRFCRPDNTTETCATCQEERAECMDCLESAQSALPEECVLPSRTDLAQGGQTAAAGGQRSGVALRQGPGTFARPPAAVDGVAVA